MSKFIHKTTIVDENTTIGENTKIWAFSHLCDGCKIGDNCVIGEGVYIGTNVTIGNNCKIQNHALIYEGVTIENNVFIGPNVVTTNDFTPKVGGDWKNDGRFKPTFIKSGSSIGANTTIICGVTIENNTLIGAGSVVTKDTEKNYLYYGNPSKKIRKI